jgi:urease accessory protein
MGMIGHLDAQKVLLRIRPVLVDLLENAADPDSELHAYAPHVEIAAMRHENQDGRLFAN